MKQYTAPKVVVFEIEIVDVIAASGGTIGIDPNPSTDFAAQRRSSSWSDYEN